MHMVCSFNPHNIPIQETTVNHILQTENRDLGQVRKCANGPTGVRGYVKT